MTAIISTLFTNFAKYGTPNADETNPFSLSYDTKWEPVKIENPINCLNICLKPKMEEVEKLKRCVPQAEAYSKLHEWLNGIDETEYKKFIESVKLSQW